MTDQHPDRFPETPVEKAPTHQPPPDPPNNHPMTDSQILDMLESKQ